MVSSLTRLFLFVVLKFFSPLCCFPDLLSIFLCFSILSLQQAYGVKRPLPSQGFCPVSAQPPFMPFLLIFLQLGVQSQRLFP